MTNNNVIKEYLEILEKEVLMLKDIFQGVLFDSLYIGGGTPSLLDSEELMQLMDIIHANFKFNDGIQKAIEVNPASMSEKKWQILGRNGINRLTIGVQTASENQGRDVHCHVFISGIRQCLHIKHITGDDVLLCCDLANLPGIFTNSIINDEVFD